VKLRAERLTELLPEAGVELLLVTELVNVRYLTGYTGSNGLAVIGADARRFITDFRYVEQAAQEVEASFEREPPQRDLLEAVPDILPGERLRLGFEEAHVTVREYARLREIVPESVELIGVSGLVEGLRAVKEPGELEKVRAAVALADASFEEVLGAGLIGRTEREVAIAIEHDMRMRGAQRPSFETIVAAGAHGALPHAQPREVTIRRGDMVVIDWGAELDGYCSDATRTVAAGEPSEDARDIYQLVLEAQLAGVQAVKDGAGGREVDGAARGVIEQAGYGERFGHGLGHGVGIDVHEAPRLSQRSEDRLTANNVVTVEPGIYLPERFGVRIEDTVVVTADGCEVLTALPKQLRVVG
jgi:Xaa-Pro aminopeptidase